MLMLMSGAVDGTNSKIRDGNCLRDVSEIRTVSFK